MKKVEVPMSYTDKDLALLEALAKTIAERRK